MKEAVWNPGDDPRFWTPLEGRLRLKSIEACERQDWSLLSWPRIGLDLGTGELRPDSGTPAVRPFLCGSWRCRRCARWRGAVDFSRCSVGVRSRKFWVYAVLTFDPANYRDRWECFEAAGECWDSHLRQALRNELGRFAYLQTWERHLSGWPHVNLILSGESLRDLVERGGVEEREHHGRTCLFPRRFRQWLRAAAQRAGFGPVAWVEVLRQDHADAMAGYLVKLARELTGASSKKGDQSPLMAPKGFRRLRASRGLLPPGPGRRTEGPITGAVIPVRCDNVARPARTTGTREPSAARTWDHVLAALEEKARRDAEAWAST